MVGVMLERPDACVTLRSPPRFIPPSVEYNGGLQAPGQSREPLLKLGEATRSDWDAAATLAARQRLATSPLQLVVLGSSPTSGCGATDEAWDGKVIDSPRPSKCTFSGSWAEMAHSLVSARVELASTQVWAKNAVGPTFYARCLGRRIPPNSTVVVFELTATNVWGVSASELVALVDRVRSLGPALVASGGSHSAQISSVCKCPVHV